MTPAFVLCLLGGVLHVDGTLGAPPLAAFVIAAVSAGALPLRHREPALALAITVACGMVVAPLGLLLTPIIIVPALVSAYAFALSADRGVSIGVLVPAAALLAISTPWFEGAFSWADVSRMVTVAAAPLVAGVLAQSVRDRRAYLAAVEERAQQAEATRDSEARRRVEEERVRIARELHDVVAHQITLANAQAMVAEQLFDVEPGAARASLHDVVGTTRHALDDLRATVGLLRQPKEGVEPAEPAPGLAQLPTLLESFRRAGLKVSLSEEGIRRPLPPGTDLTTYRIVQEALTNVTRHARADTARVSLGWEAGRLVLSIADDGSDMPKPPGSPPGFGLLGMRERATALGGRLSAGRAPEGGFLVAAELPIPMVQETDPDRREDNGNQ